jgi:Protein kinase domain/Tetratricopeptide repeat
MATNQGRGKDCYRAPEVLLESMSGFNQKSDIWSLGCIIFKLCTGNKLFKNELTAYRFITSNEDLSTQIEFPTWFAAAFAADYRSLICWMLTRDHQLRPTVHDVFTKLNHIASFLAVRESEVDVKDFGTQILGTDFPSRRRCQLIRWEKGLPGGTPQQHASTIKRWKLIYKARENIIGPPRSNTVWAMMCLGYSHLFAGECHEAFELFCSALEILKTYKGDEHLYTMACYAAIGHAFSTAGNHDQAIQAFDVLIKQQIRLFGDGHPYTLASCTASARAEFLKSATNVQKIKEKIVPNLIWISDRQKSHPDLLSEDKTETLTLLALACRCVPEFRAEGNTRLLGLLTDSTDSSNVSDLAVLAASGFAWSCLRTRQIDVARDIIAPFDPETQRATRENYAALKRLFEAAGVYPAEARQTAALAIANANAAINRYAGAGISSSSGNVSSTFVPSKKNVAFNLPGNPFARPFGIPDQTSTPETARPLPLPVTPHVAPTTPFPQTWEIPQHLTSRQLRLFATGSGNPVVRQKIPPMQPIPIPPPHPPSRGANTTSMQNLADGIPAFEIPHPKFPVIPNVCGKCVAAQTIVRPMMRSNSSVDVRRTGQSAKGVVICD